MGPVVGRSAGHNTVEIVGEALRLHESFTAAVGTTDEVAAGGRSAVERLHDGAGLQCGFVNRAVAEIDQLFRVSDGPGCAGSGVAVVSPCDGEAALERLGEGYERNVSGPSAVADLLIFSVPVAGREPKLEIDFGIGGGARGGFHIAVGRDFRSGRYDCGRRNGGVGYCELRQALAGLLRRER